ncbi:toxin-antitoxin system TumE family protein [Desulfonatronum parangueonense]
MQASIRLLEIEEKFEQIVQRIVPIELDDETLRLILYFKDGSNLRVAEQWNGDRLLRYSYYWLTAENKLNIGWDNAPHHKQFETYPHHRHVEKQNILQPSNEKCLEDVMQVIGSSILNT